MVLLSGGTGGAKLARGLLAVASQGELAVIANTGDDIEIYGALVSPDPDLVTFWLADQIDPRGWGIRGDTFAVMEGLRALGREVWFNLGDRDLAWCLVRTQLMAEGISQSNAQLELCRRLGLKAQVIPMADHPYRTFVNGMPLQQFLIREGGTVREVRLAAPDGSENPPPPAPAAAAALEAAALVVVGPSNPVISIGPIVRVVAPLLRRTQAPVVMVSPFVEGRVLKGPTDRFLAGLGFAPNLDGALAFYRTLGLRIDGVIADQRPSAPLPSLLTNTLMDSGQQRRELAAAVLRFGRTVERRS